jgi:trimeric autotransporter adhesin
MRKLYVVFVLLFVLIAKSSICQTSGIFESYAIVSINASANAYYDLQPTTGNPDFDGANLGSFIKGINTLVFRGGQNKTYKNGGCNILNSSIWYRVFPTGFPAGAFIGITEPFAFNIGGSGDQQWEEAGNTTELISSLPLGNYTLQVYTQADFDGCGNGTHFIINGGANYNATFSVVCNPATLPSVVIADAPASPICAGTNVTFTATPTNGGAAPTYQWKLNGTTVGAGLATYSNAALANGDAVSVVMTSNDPLVCVGSLTVTSNTITETINPLLPASVSITAAPAGAICAGTSVTFTATPTNGGGAPIYQWKLNGANVGAGLATYSNAALVNGNIVTVEMTSNASPCLTGSPALSTGITMTVNPLPTVVAITGANNMPLGSTTTYASATSGGTWTSASTGIATINTATGVITGVAAGTSIITYTVTGGGCTNTVTKTITVVAANVWVSSTLLPANDAGYTTIKLAFDAINAGTHTAVVAISIYGNTTETTAAALNASGSGAASYTSLSIQPVGARTVSGNIAAPLIDLNGSDNVTINGLNSGGNSLTISNASAASTVGTSTIRFINDATTNTITNCTLLSANTVVLNAAGGTVLFSTTTGTTGNDGNTISNNNIGDNAGGTPLQAIVSLGTSTKANSGNIISGNNIYNYFATSNNVGINLFTNSDAFTISANKFYQTAARPTAAATSTAIRVVDATGNNFTITNNIIGYANASGTGTTSFGAATTAKFVGIDLTVGTTIASSVQGNTIAGISLSSNSGSTPVPGIFVGIYTQAGLVNIGNVTANSVKDLTLVNSNLASYWGIYSNQTTGSPSISKNLLNNIKINNAASVGVNFYGIQITGAASFTLDANEIGSTTADDIRVGVSGTNTSAAFSVWGINNNSTGASLNITNNKINNIAVYTSGGTTTAPYLRGIELVTAFNPTASSISGNTIANLKNTGLNTGTGTSASVVGIHNSSSATISINNNTIHTLKNTNIGAGTISVTGIRAGSTGTVFSKNIIHSLSTAGSGLNQIYGFTQSGGTWNISNNMIRLGIDDAGASVAGNYDIKGMDLSLGSCNVYHNSIYIGGAAAAGGQITYAIQSSSFNIVKNNIIVNRRTSATANSQIGLLFGGVGATTQDANLYYVDGATGGVIAKSGATNYSTLIGLQGVSAGRDINSVNSDPQFISATGNAATVDLHINTASASEVESGGLTGLGIADDIDALNIRCPIGGCPGASTKPDIGADEGLFTPADLTPPVVNTFSIANQTTTTGPTVAVTITDNVAVKITAGSAPRIYYKRCSDANVYNDNTSGTTGWKYVESTTGSSPFSFTLNYSLLNGSVTEGTFINYFVVAQDAANNVGINTPLAFATTPTNINLLTANLPSAVAPNYVIQISTATTFTVGTGSTFPTITGSCGCFAAINGSNATLPGNIILNITSDLTEDNSNQLSSSGVGNNRSVTIYPADATLKTISGTLGGASPAFTTNAQMIGVNTKGILVADGRVGGSGTGQYLLFRNTNATAANTWPVFKDNGFGGTEAVSLTLQYITIESNETDASLGNVYCYSGSGVHNLNVNNCIFREATGGTIGSAVTAISFNEASTNTGTVSITNNEFKNFIAGTGSTGVLNFFSGNTATITGNSFYATNTISTSTWYAMYIASGNVGAFTISNNFIGGSNATATGSVFNHTGTGKFIGINCLNTGAAHTISGNTINNISTATTDAADGFTGIRAHCGAASASTVSNNIINNIATTSTTTGGFYGISTQTGLANYTGNKIGDTLVATSINHAGTSPLAGIYASITGGTSYDITSNIIGGITSKTTTNGVGFAGIYSNPATATSIININGNRIKNITLNATINTTTNRSTAYGIFSANGVNNIGTLALPNTVNTISNNGDGLTTVYPYTVGIYVGGSPASGTITYNSIKNLSTGAITGTSASTKGIWNATTAANINISNNTISALSSSNQGVTVSATAPGPSVVGIQSNSTGATQLINDNNINALSSTNTAAFSASAVGISTSTGTGSILRNKIYGFTNQSTGSNPFISGYIPNGGSWTFANNMISLSNAALTNGMQCTGVYDAGASGTRNYYHNTIYVGGSSTGTQNSVAMQCNAGAGTIAIRNNILNMTRTGNGGNYAIANLGASFTGLTTNYNILNAANSATVGVITGLVNKTFAAWQTSSAGEANSFTAVPITFIDPANGDLHIATNNCALVNGTYLATVATDIDGDTRANPKPVIGADEITMINPTAIITVTGTNPICLGNSTTLNVALTGLANWSYTYTVNGASPTVVSTATTSPNTLALSPTITTTYALTNVTSGSCVVTSGFGASATVTVNPTSIGGTVSTDQTICSGATPTALMLAGNVGTVTKWQSASDAAFTTPTDIANVTTTLTLGALTTTTYYRAVVQSGVCLAANSSNATITVNPNITPTFTAVASVCANSIIVALPTTSNNGITGTWGPALDNTQTTIYTFTPAGGQCATTTTLTITVTANVTPTFTSIAPICNGGSLSALPTTSNNGITGTWSPTSDNTQTTLYTFTPAGGQCATTTTLTITVTANVTPTFTSIAPICNGASLSALPTISNNGITGTWSPALDNTQTTLYTFTPAGGQCATTTTLTITVNTVGAWMGVNTNWFDVNNWPCGGVPTATTNVIIPAGLINYPIIGVGFGTPVAIANNINIAPTASIIIGGAATFELHGTITNNGTFDITAGTLNMAGATAQTLAGNSITANSVKNLVLSNSVDLSSEVKITTSLNFSTIGNILNTNGNLTVVSNATGTAYLGNTTGNTITGTATIERYLRAIKSWRYLATPVDTTTSPSINNSWREGGTTLTSNGLGTRITGPGAVGLPLGVDQNTQRGSMKSYSSTTNTFVEITSANLAAGKKIANDEGYAVFVNGDRGEDALNPTSVSPTTLRIKGNIRTGNQTFYITAPAVAVGGFQSVGNPYPSQINFVTVTRNSIAATFYIWNPIGGYYGVGQYENYAEDFMNPTHYTRNGTPNGTPYDFIESGQAFFIQTLTPTGGDIVIKETDKSTGSSLVSRDGAQSRLGVTIPTLEINLHTNNIGGNDFVADGVMLNFGTTYSSALDNSDIRKITNSVDNLAIKYGTKNLVVERRPNLTETDTIKLGLTSTRIAPYRFEIDPSVLSNTGLAAFLKDKFLQTETAVSLTAVTNVNFAITADAGSKVADRFMIIFRQAVGGPLPVRFIEIAADKNADKTNTVKWNVGDELNIQHYEIERSENGRNFSSIGNAAALNNTGGSYAYNFLDATPLAQDNYYRVKAISINGQTQYSAIVRVVAETKETSIAVYPNPVEDKLVKIHFTSNTGKYSVSLLNAAGKTVYTKNIKVVSNNETHTMEINKSFAVGSYSLVLVSEDGTKKILPIVIL